MWGVGLTMCIFGMFGLFTSPHTFRDSILLFAIVVTGLVAMWVGS